jgi:hypothetical protein
MPSFDFELNGTKRGVDADGATPLLWILRDALGMTGTKYGCGEGYCGACTVLEDGDELRARPGDERPRGIGEPTVCPFAPAAVNALSRLVGRRLRELPVTSAAIA